MNHSFNIHSGSYSGTAPRDVNTLVAARVAIYLRQHPAGKILPEPQKDGPK